MNKVLPLEFPAIALDNVGRVCGYVRTSERLSSCTLSQLKHGIFKGWLFVGADLRCVKVKKPEIIGSYGWFWGLTPYLEIRKKIRFELDGEPYAISFLELKELMMLKEYPRSLGYTEQLKKEAREKVLATKDFEELIKVFFPTPTLMWESRWLP